MGIFHSYVSLPEGKLYDPNWDIGIPRNWTVHHTTVTTARHTPAYIQTYSNYIPERSHFFLRTHSNLHSFHFFGIFFWWENTRK